MAEPSSGTRVLFVDDEASIRMTLPPILAKEGFQVQVAGSVSEALSELKSRQFDVLISDLNIGEEGDGFVVTNAMRQTQPGCLTFILTGYPAFETALQAIRNHIDDYLVKPVDISSLVSVLREKLQGRDDPGIGASPGLTDFLRQNLDVIVDRVSVAANGNGKPAGASKRELASFTKRFLEVLIVELESGPGELSPAALRLALQFGAQNAKDGRPANAIAVAFRRLEQGIYGTVQDNMSGMDNGALLAAIGRINAVLHSLLEVSLDAWGKPAAAGAKR